MFNNENIKNFPRPVILMFSCFTVWHMAIFWYGSTTGFISVYNKVSIPIQGNILLIAFAAFLIGIITIWIFPTKSLLLSRICGLVALFSSIMLFFPLPNVVIKTAFYIMVFCCPFLTAVSICLLICFFKTNEVWLECIFEIFLVGIALTILHNDFKLTFELYNLISVIMLTLCTISYFIIKIRWKTDFLEYKAKANPVSNWFYFGIAYISFIGNFIITVAFIIAETFNNGILMLFCGMVASTLLTVILVNKFKINLLRMLSIYISFALIGFTLITIDGLAGISFFILGIPASLSFWGVYLGNVAFNLHKTRYISPFVILIGFLSSIIGVVFLNFFKNNSSALVLALCSISVGFIALYFIFSPYFYKTFTIISKKEDVIVPLLDEVEVIEVKPEKVTYSKNTFDLLTVREKEVVELVLSGYTRGQIAALLFISLSTVKTHMKNIYSKLEINSKRDLFQIAENLKEDKNIFIR